MKKKQVFLNGAMKPPVFCNANKYSLRLRANVHTSQLTRSIEIILSVSRASLSPCCGLLFLMIILLVQLKAIPSVFSIGPILPRDLKYKKKIYIYRKDNYNVQFDYVILRHTYEDVESSNLYLLTYILT